MVKFLIALAEMFSAFAAKLHDMSEDMPEQLTSLDVRNIIKEMPDSLERNDVIEIVQEAINDGDIITKQECDDDSIIEADDIKGLSSAITSEIDDYDFDEKIDDRLFYTAVQNIVLPYAWKHGIDTREIYVHSEEFAMQRYLKERAEVWTKEQANAETRAKLRIIQRHEAEQARVDETVTVPCPATLKLSDGTTVREFRNH
jgi:hypothetical protein